MDLVELGLDYFISEDSDTVSPPVEQLLHLLVVIGFETLVSCLARLKIVEELLDRISSLFVLGSSKISALWVLGFCLDHCIFKIK